MLVQLPRTRFIVTLPISIGLNLDGTINAETATTRDIPLDINVDLIKYLEDNYFQ